MERAYAIRRSIDADQNEVTDLEFPDKDARKTYFGRVLLSSIIETAYLSLTATDPERHERILGFAAFDNAPPGKLRELPGFNDYLQYKYDLARPSTWSYLVYFAQRHASNASSRTSVLKHLLHTLFCTLTTRERVLLVLPTSIEMDNEASFNKLFQKVKLRRDNGDDIRNNTADTTSLSHFMKDMDTFDKYIVYEAVASDFLPAVHVRKARVEDHDDLEPILKRQSGQVASMFGDYFLAELIHDQNDHNVCLITEGQDSGRAVGMLSLSDEIDISALQENFELAPYNHLAKSSIETSRVGKITPPKFIICGPPAGGKGTQCELLVEEFGVVHLSTGDMLRAAIFANSPLGLLAKSYMDAGDLVPDEVIIDVIIERLQLPDCQTRGWLLDGFPRTQAQALSMLKYDIVPDLVIILEVPDEEVVTRISGRRIDPETGKTYHLEFNPPPLDEALRARLIQRSDDTEETIHFRLLKFHENCAAVVNSFTGTSKVLYVNGMQNKQIISQAICETTHRIKQAQKFRVLVGKGKLATPKFIITGPPAGGKGTQCEVLVEHFDVVHLSTGDMLRASIQAGAPLGLKAKAFMDAGELVPDELIIDVILARLQESDCVKKGWLLDGFPRTAAQARAMMSQGVVPDCVLVLDVPDEEVVRRISGRRVDLSTGRTYHLDFNPPPPEIRDRVVQRSDDNEETIRCRLERYHENCDAVLEAFTTFSTDVQLIRCDGMQPKNLIIEAFTQPTYAKMKEFETKFQITTTNSAGGSHELKNLEMEEAKDNCFAITLFCMDDKYDFSASDMLVNAFAAFPDKEFCLLTLPTTAAEPSFLGFFTFVSPKPTSTFTHVLYLLHRDAISFFKPSAGGIAVLNPVNLTLHRYMGTTDPADPVCDQTLNPFLQFIDPFTRLSLAQQLAKAHEESDVELEENPRNVAFVVNANASVVGIVTLSRNHDFASVLKNHFDLDSFMLLTYHRSKDQAIVEHFILNPIFYGCARYILEELMRVFNKSCFFYQVSTQVKDKKTPRIGTVLQEFVLAPPRRSIAISSDEVAQYPEDAEKVRHAANYDTFALFAITKKLLSEPKVVINQRLVVVGASDAALALLKRLLSVPYLRWTNVTLISPLGLEFVGMDELDPLSPTPHVQPVNASDFARKSLFTTTEINQFSLRTHIRVIESRVVQIDRLTKAVILMDGSCLPYDYLVLTSGLQDGTCTSLGRLPTFDGDQYTPSEIPPQMIPLHDARAAQVLHDQLQNELAAQKETPIVVYGSSLFALQVIHGLLKRGVEGSRIVHISPMRDGVFEDETIRAEIDRQYEKEGIAIYHHSKIVSLTVEAHTGALEGVHITSSTAFTVSHGTHHHESAPPHNNHHNQTTIHNQPHVMNGSNHHHHSVHQNHHHSNDHSNTHSTTSMIRCGWLLCCQQNDADYDIFRAINESGLVYDGRLVVNGHMRTTDPHIFGTGPLCRFSRRFIHAKLQEHYNSKECGELLATSLLRILDPLSVGHAIPSRSSTGGADDFQLSKHKQPIKNISSGGGSPSSPSRPQSPNAGQTIVPPPEMHMPVIKTAVILGGKNYVQISVPSLTNTLSLQPLPTNVPSDPEHNQQARYTCLLFDDFGVLNRLEYLGDAPIEIDNLQCVVGLHESYLNSALASFTNAYIDDWIAFFHQKWAATLFHDRFQEFCVHLNGFLKKDDGVRQLVEDVVRFFNETGDLKGASALAQVRVGRGGDALVPSTKRLIESHLLEFLSANRDILNMYLLPRGSSSSNSNTSHKKKPTT